MAMQVGNSVGRHNPDMVGNAFAQDYYRVLNVSPENVHKFYHNESILDRPDSDGSMRSITTTHAIKNYYLTTDLKGCSVQIDNVIAQTSHVGYLLILVVGSFIMPDTVKRRFSQSFFLAPQGIGGYFVTNDILQYLSAGPETLPVKENTEPVKESMDLELPFSHLYIS